ncbi:MAG: energy-coupling factor transporter transmembrane protein EcfT [Oscillospiraceae bacterium]|nr:energy-coupling factor transporter transmembrane protein EcfT [Oscillospiraceae bacterium]
MGFERCHPAVNFIYFAAVIAGMILFQHPVFLAISFACAFIYSVKRNGWKAVAFNSVLLPLVAAFALYYSSYTHFGVTVLQQNFIGNNMTLEALVYGFVLGLVVAGVMIWFSCVYSVFTTDKVVYLFGKVSPRMSLFLAILLRMVPRIKKEARKINTAQRGIGRGANQGNLWQRTRNCIRIFSMLITWTIDSLTTASESMRSRGSSLRGRRAFSIYRFDNRDRAYVVALFACLTVTLMAVLLQQTDIIYDPRIIMTPVTSMSYVFYAGYAVFCLMPLMLELWTEYRFKKARRSL